MKTEAVGLSLSDGVCTQAELSEVLGITRQRVGQLVQEEVLAYAFGAGKKFRLGESVRAYMEYRLRSDGASPGAVARYNEEKAEHEAVRRQMSELRLAVLRGELVRTEDVEKCWESLVTACRGVLLGLPGRLGAALAAEDRTAGCVALLDTGIRQALEELAGMEVERIGREAAEVDLAGDDCLEAPATPDGEPVGG